MLIRNKFRNLQASERVTKTEPYQPEYKRIGVTPMQPSIKGAAVNQVEKPTIPKNVRVNSGQNEELAWVPKQRSDQNSQKQVKDENEEVVYHDVRTRTFVNENFDDGINNKPISYDEIPDYVSNIAAPSENSSNFASFGQVTVGEFVLIFDNEILGSGTLQEVTDAVEELLLSDNSGSISHNSLIVLKRMQIMTGVLIKDV